MESTRRSTPPAPEADRKDQERAQKEQTDKEIAERVASPPEQPTPTQEEADAFKEGAAEAPAEPPPEAARHGETAHQRREREEKERQQRDVKPEQGRSGYQTRT